MKKVIATVYFFYCGFIAGLLYLLFSPFFLVVVYFLNPHTKTTYYLNKLYSFILFSLFGVPVKIKGKENIEKSKHYIYCPNHRSYIDIPLVSLAASHLIVYIGKKSLTKLPLFGNMFKKIHISVDRSNMKDRYSTLISSKKILDKKISICYFPEGGIKGVRKPCLQNFQNGAFWLAIETQTPIVPVSIPYSWKFLFKIQKKVYWNKLAVEFHTPIETKGMKIEDIEILKKKVYHTIKNNVYQLNGYEVEK